MTSYYIIRHALWPPFKNANSTYKKSIMYKYVIYFQGRPLDGATGAVAPSPTLRGERDCESDRGGLLPYLAPGPVSAKDGPVYFTLIQC